MGSSTLPSWNDTASRQAIIRFVGSVTDETGQHYVPPPERIAVFDNDGTLWCEKPTPVELGFILTRLAGMADSEPALRERQPWKAACTNDYAWLGEAITKHYRGDDSDVKVIIGGILKAFNGMSMETYIQAAGAFLAEAQNPALKRRCRDAGYVPMVELLRYLEANEFTNYIASGGDRDFMRCVTEEIYGVPPERVIGSTNALRYQDGASGGGLVYQENTDVFDDGPAKPVRIWSRVGRRPILAAGNSNGDIEMLQYAGGPGRRALRLLVLHDDQAREFDYVGGAEKSLDLAERQGWTVVSMKNDWSTMFAS
jgi:hypothetical protein